MNTNFGQQLNAVKKALQKKEKSDKVKAAITGLEDVCFAFAKSIMRECRRTRRA